MQRILAKPDPVRTGEQLLAIVKTQARNPSGGSHLPTEEMRLLARLWTEIGASQALIARELGIDPDTLVKHYADELSGGEERGVANMAAALYEKGLRGDTAAMIFYLKAKGRRAGWIDKEDDKPGANGATQLDVVAAVLQTVQALKSAASGQAVPLPAPARVIEHKPRVAVQPIDDGRDLL